MLPTYLHTHAPVANTLLDVQAVSREHIKAAKEKKTERVKAAKRHLGRSIKNSGKARSVVVAVGVDPDMRDAESNPFYLAEVKQVMTARSRKKVGAPGAYWNIKKTNRTCL